ncbi:MAG: tRNA (uridine(34)/cytosine(34)/5-carboxymethylaminomethyluridine(34)-2'-O)-methyltransferase TrmL [Gammaproteobacteria bacterium]|nr:tRNA (uridine(34)/cytosine(34)/5-carboxymethylaminomethyluridine(34)-2'-O)-methyltransferase TrmL [Gammaproteobacteria bacterium]
MFHIVLFEPEIPPNTGNIIRLCANTGARLHLIQPLGFELNDKKLRRAGLDYSEFASVSVYSGLDAYIEAAQPERIIACSTKGKKNHTEIEFKTGDSLLFGPETRGLPDSVLETIPEGQCIRIPMVENSRSLNLSNAVSIILYEAWRQSGFIGIGNIK